MVRLPYFAVTLKQVCTRASVAVHVWTVSNLQRSFCNLDRCASFPPQNKYASSGLCNLASGKRRKSTQAAALAEDGADVACRPEAQQETKAPHIPVLANDVLGFFEGRELRTFVDCTLGAGGHSSLLLQAHPELELLVGLDVDPVAHAEAKPRLQRAVAKGTGGPEPEVQLLVANFRNVRSALKSLGRGLENGGVSGMLLDLGFSSMQVDLAERGFSFLQDGPMDMRMDPRAPVQAEHILNDWPEDDLGRILRDYGEERYWRSLAKKIVLARAERGPIRTTRDLVEIIGGPRIGSAASRKGRKGGPRPIHPATRTFQALRIAVNDELNSLDMVLPQAISCLAPGGRLGVISFHSLEDRIVKRAFRAAAGLPTGDEDEDIAAGWGGADAEKASVKILTKRPVTAGEEEKAANPRSRSAKLRFVEKL